MNILGNALTLINHCVIRLLRLYELAVRTYVCVYRSLKTQLGRRWREARVFNFMCARVPSRYSFKSNPTVIIDNQGEKIIDKNCAMKY